MIRILHSAVFGAALFGLNVAMSATAQDGGATGVPGAEARRADPGAAAGFEGVGDMGASDLRGGVAPAEWRAWSDAFLAPEGRVVDGLSGGISHSEGQGYGMLLALAADDAAGFERIWTFTRDELLRRDDGLLSWRWDPAADPHVTDANNATDGDILVAQALILGGAAWERADFAGAGRDLADAIGRKLRFEWRGEELLLPGAIGFTAQDQPDGPVINPSYWVFEALALFDRVAPGSGWGNVLKDGVALMDDLRFGPAGLPSDWVSLKGGAKPAEAFPARFGYNALRIPLYLVRGGIRDRGLLERLRAGMLLAGPGALAIVDVESGAARERLTDPGYRIQPALISCVLDMSPLPEDLRTFRPTTYYPSTLHLLALAYARKELGACLS